jgi:hypothetical protein
LANSGSPAASRAAFSATCGSLYQQAVLVAQARRQPVDLGLGHQVERRVLGKAQEAPRAAQELHHLGRFHGVVEREHRHPMGDLAERLDRRRADPMRGAVRTDQFGKARFDLAVAPAQRVVLGIRDLGRGVAIVEAVVMGDLGREPLQLGARLLGRQLVHGNRLGHARKGVRPSARAGCRRQRAPHR